MNPHFFMLAYDWVYAYRPAALALLSGHSPYLITSEKFVNAPWLLLPLIPLALLPDWLGWLVMVFAGMAAFVFVAHRLSAKPITMIAFLLSPCVLQCLYYGQIDWLPIMGVILPPLLGLFFVAAKPQTCGFIAIYWLIEAWKTHTVIKTFAPVIVTTLLSFIPYGIWPIYALRMGMTNKLWPFTLIMSAVLLIVSQTRKDKTFAAAASPFASPYIRFHSFASALLPLMRRPWLMVAMVAELWIARGLL